LIELLQRRIKYDRLGVNDALLQFENDFSKSVLPEPERALPLLDQIAGDSRFVEIARQRSRPWPSASVIRLMQRLRRPERPKVRYLDENEKLAFHPSEPLAQARHASALRSSCSFAFASRQKKEKLAKTYREWLEHDVVYIITKDERVRFLASRRTIRETNLSRTSGSP